MKWRDHNGVFVDVIRVSCNDHKQIHTPPLYTAWTFTTQVNRGGYPLTPDIIEG